MSSVASSLVSFFCLCLFHTYCQSVWFIRIVNLYVSCRLTIHKNHTNWQSVRFIWIVNPYGSYRLEICKNHMAWQSIRFIRIDQSIWTSQIANLHAHTGSLMYHIDCQFVWFNAIKNENVWKRILTARTHDGMEECMLITTKGRDGLTTQQGVEGGVHGVGDLCEEGWCIWFLTEGYFDLFTTLVGYRRSYLECWKKFPPAGVNLFFKQHLFFFLRP